MGSCESCPGQGFLPLPCYKETAEHWGPVTICDAWETCLLGCSRIPAFYAFFCSEESAEGWGKTEEFSLRLSC